MLKTFSITEWQANLSQEMQKEALEELENGHILYFPALPFQLLPEEHGFLTTEHADPHTKNISYQYTANKLWGVQRLNDAERMQLKEMLDRFSRYSLGLIQAILPLYAKQLIIARTSFRPIQISNRKSSYRKDDKRLHVDAFPSAPNQGKRILRVFTNINPYEEERVWHLGEPFEKVAQRFVPHISKPFPGKSSLLRLLKITKSYRTLYDHYMLHIHDNMKANEAYQQQVKPVEVRFPTGSTWIVQTDQVSHAAIKGQYVLEQTFYLPIAAMKNEARSPLRILENLLHQRLA